LSFWSGRISDYWFQRDADIILNTPETLHRIVTQIQGAPAGGAHIERWHPSENDIFICVAQQMGGLTKANLKTFVMTCLSFTSLSAFGIRLSAPLANACTRPQVPAD